MGNIIVGATLVLYIALIIRSLFKKHKEGRPVACDDCTEHDACPYMAMPKEELLETLKKKANLTLQRAEIKKENKHIKEKIFEKQKHRHRTYNKTF